MWWQQYERDTARHHYPYDRHLTRKVFISQTGDGILERLWRDGYNDGKTLEAIP
ncbi:MAG: hypothetical protein KZQ93_09195 [Candidatus Thiodiazotropha sp. (ex Monitilora ramsayi)]|nr:hypothetical protein [Candidatus Thiodiazotropha sp. (ex Monitilora ramsayi)]